MVLANGLTPLPAAGPAPFRVVSASAWYAPFVRVASQAGLVEGVGGDDRPPPLAAPVRFSSPMPPTFYPGQRRPFGRWGTYLIRLPRLRGPRQQR